ncbi:MAG: hypothetical protein ABIH23_19190 [bacterium]
MHNRNRAFSAIKRAMRKSVAFGLSTLFFMFFASMVWSVPGTWEPLGPEGGQFLGCVTNPSDPSQVTAITSNPATVYRSSNGGNSWTKISEPPSESLNDACAYDYSTWYAIRYDTCYRSTDGGTTWTTHELPANVYDASYYVSAYAYKICVDPSNSSKVYAAGQAYVYSSTDSFNGLAFFSSADGGQSWRRTEAFSFDYFSPSDMAVAKTADGDMIYVCGYKGVESGGSIRLYGALLKSADGGENWLDITDSIGIAREDPISCIGVDPTDGNRLYITYGGLFCMSTDGGSSWTRIPRSIESPQAIAVDPSDPSRMYVCNNEYLYVGTEYGKNWTTSPRYAIRGYSCSVEIASGNPSNVYVATSIGLYKSIDYGATFEKAHNGIYNTIIPALAVAPSDPSVLYAEYQGVSVFGSTDGGNTWEDKNLFSNCGNVCDLVVHATDPNTVIALAGG